MEEGSAASPLRLSSARRRIDAFIEQIDVLAASSFPHEDGKKALGAIRRHCLDLRQRLDLPATTREDVIDGVCQSLLDNVATYTEILGFILRSTNVRNPFELHSVVKGQIRKALGDDVSLLISSEWDYNPFTYPMSIDQLPDAILIGTPAPEASNPLLIPLAGHEVGHSAWRVYDCTPRYIAPATEAVRGHLERDEKTKRELVNNAPLGGLEIERVVNQCAAHVMQQLEEVFCDIFGLYLFGHAYVAAFDYLLGPGNHNRALEYPSDHQRMQFLVAAAVDLDLTLDQAMTSRWTDGQVMRSDRAMATVTDAVTASLFPQIRDDLVAELERRGLRPPVQANVDTILDAFQHGEPYADRMELGEIISAGWLRLRQLDDQKFDDDPKTDQDKRSKSYRVLADLVLKTVEIVEYHDRIASVA